MSADDRLADGRRIADVLAEDERERERERAAAAEREERQEDAWLNLAFCLELPQSPPPQSQPPPHPDKDPDLHGGARRSVESGDDALVDVYVDAHFGGIGS